jgi:hypothetical protein
MRDPEFITLDVKLLERVGGGNAQEGFGTHNHQRRYGWSGVLQQTAEDFGCQGWNRNGENVRAA